MTMNQFGNGLRALALVGLSYVAGCAAPREVVEVHHYLEAHHRLITQEGAIFVRAEGEKFQYQVPFEPSYVVDGSTAHNLVQGLTNIAAGRQLHVAERTFDLGNSKITYSHFSISGQLADDSVLLKVLRAADPNKDHTITSEEAMKLLEQQRKNYGSALDILLAMSGCPGRRSEALLTCEVDYRGFVSSCNETQRTRNAEEKYIADEGKKSCASQRSGDIYQAEEKAKACASQKSNVNYQCKESKERKVSECSSNEYGATERLQSWKYGADYACENNPTVGKAVCLENNRQAFSQKKREIQSTLTSCKSSATIQFDDCTSTSKRDYDVCMTGVESDKEQAQSEHASCVANVEVRHQSMLEASHKDLESCLASAVKDGEAHVSRAEEDFIMCEAGERKK